MISVLPPPHPPQTLHRLVTLCQALYGLHLPLRCLLILFMPSTVLCPPPITAISLPVAAPCRLLALVKPRMVPFSPAPRKPPSCSPWLCCVWVPCMLPTPTRITFAPPVMPSVCQAACTAHWNKIKEIGAPLPPASPTPPPPPPPPPPHILYHLWPVPPPDSEASSEYHIKTPDHSWLQSVTCITGLLSRLYNIL